MVYGSDTSFRAAEARYEEIVARYQALVARTDERMMEQKAADDEATAQAEREMQETLARWAAEEEKAKDAEQDKKPENPWAQRPRLPDAGARIGQIEDDEYDVPEEPPSPPAPPPRPVAVDPEPEAAPATPPAPEPAQPSGSRWAPDDDEDFEQGNFLRG